MTKTGLAWSRWLEPIDEFVRRHGREARRWAIACTYELELATLERSILPTFGRRGAAFRTVVLADAGILERVIDGLAKPLTGAVNVHAVRVSGGGVFHPKLLLLRAGPHARVCFGSANLTSGGLAGNLELWTHSEDKTVISGVVAFLDGVLASKSIELDPAARRCLRWGLLGLPRARAPEVWSSLEEPFAKRLRRTERRPRRAVIMSPLYATAGGLALARSAIPAHDCILCTDQPINSGKVSIRTLRREAAEAEVSDDDLLPSVLHAKAYAFEQSDRSAAVWTGSANFTARALTRSVADGGNVELMVRARLPRDEWQRFRMDLEHNLFEVPKGPRVAPPQIGEPMPVARATVIGAELTMGASSAVFLVSSTRRSGAIRLEFGGRSVKINIRAGRGRLEGLALRTFFPDLDLAGGAATCFRVYEVVDEKRIPVIVNVPHVRAGSEAGAGGQATLDTLAADLLGRVAVYKSQQGDDPNDVVPTENDGDEDTSTDEELEKRLDEVKHQGRLDREAVTLVVLEKLVRKAPMDQRAALRAEILKHAEATVAQHLRGAVRKMFRWQGGP